jgi:hypothetical protein
VDIRTSDVGSDVTANRVSITGSTVRVKLTTHIISSDVELGKVSPSSLDQRCPFPELQISNTYP